MINQIFLPIEIKVREFHSKLLFGLFAAERGIETVIGGQLELIEAMPKLGRGLYMDKSAAVTKLDWFTTCRNLGNHLAAWDEEGLLYLNDDVYHEIRMLPEALAMTDVFYSWGESHQKTILSRYPEREDTTVPVGNPRFDLLRPEFRAYCDPQVEELRQKYGKIILINTNFSFHNFVKGRAAAERIFDPYPLKDKEKIFREWEAFQEKGLQGYLNASIAMHERFPDHTIIIRPAPSEADELWIAHAEKYPRMHISKDGNVVEWMRASDATLQFNCTTGVEAFLLDVPTIVYRCVKSDYYETPISNSCSVKVDTEEELLERLAEIISCANNDGGESTKNLAAKKEILNHCLTAIDGPTCCERILDDLQQRTFPERPRNLPCVPLIKKVWRAWLKVVRQHDPEDIRFYRVKFPGLSVAEAKSVAASFSAITHRFENVRISKAGKNIIRIKPA